MVWLMFAALCASAIAGKDVNTPFYTQSMKAVVLSSRSFDMKLHRDKIEISDIPIPKPGFGQVLVKVHASTINPVDLQLIESPLELLWRYPHTLGFDVAGTIASFGSGCSTRLAVGDEVHAQMGTLLEAAGGGGAWAQYALVAERVLAKKPKQLNMTEAGAIPMVALTGLLNLRWAADQSERLDNKTVVVLGGSGGTGHIGIQIAKALGAREVITTCGPEHIDFVKSIGADRVFNYHTDNWYDILPNRSVDVVYDCVSAGKGDVNSGDLAFPKLSEGGRLAALEPGGLASKAAEAQRPDVKQMYRDCIADCVRYENLEILGQMVDDGKLRVHLDQIYDLQNISGVIDHLLSGHTTGKIGIIVPDGRRTVIV